MDLLPHKLAGVPKNMFHEKSSETSLPPAMFTMNYKLQVKGSKCNWFLIVLPSRLFEEFVLHSTPPCIHEYNTLKGFFLLNYRYITEYEFNTFLFSLPLFDHAPVK